MDQIELYANTIVDIAIYIQFYISRILPTDHLRLMTPPRLKQRKDGRSVRIKKYGRVSRERPRPRKTFRKPPTRLRAFPAHNKARHCGHRYDTESFEIGVDTRATACMTPVKGDMVGKLVRVNTKVDGISGSLTEVWKGTIEWTIEDDYGRRTRVRIPNSYYVPGLPERLMSPQHWAQEQRNHNFRGEPLKKHY